MATLSPIFSATDFLINTATTINVPANQTGTLIIYLHTKRHAKKHTLQTKLKHSQAKEKMRKENYEAWVKVYEDFYKKPLVYGEI